MYNITYGNNFNYGYIKLSDEVYNNTHLRGRYIFYNKNVYSSKETMFEIYRQTQIDSESFESTFDKYAGGQVFSLDSNLTVGKIWSVNDVSGLPILEVFSDDRVVMGTYGAPALVVTGSGTITSGSLRGKVKTVPTSSGTASMDCSQGNFFSLTLSGSYTLFLSASNIQPGQTVNLRVNQPTTSGSLTYGTTFKFAGGIPYTASSTASVTDLMTFISFDSTVLYASTLKNLS